MNIKSISSIAGGGGPDQFCSISFPESQGSGLLNWLQNQRFDSLEWVELNYGQVALVDCDHADEVRRNVAGLNQKNIWNYSLVRVDSSGIVFENGFGRTDPAEKTIIAKIIESGIPISHWSVFGGGQGYDTQVCRQGSNRDSFVSTFCRS